MSTNLQQKRKTKHVRIKDSFHKELKIKAATTGVTISRLLDSIIEVFLDKELAKK